MRNSSTPIINRVRWFLSLILLGLSLIHAQEVDSLLTLIDKGEIEQAEALLEAISFDNPGHPGIKYGRALLQTDALVAAGIYKDIVRNHPNTSYMSGSLMRLAEYYYAQGLYVQSRQLFMRLIKYYPESENISYAVNLSLRAGIAARQIDSVYIDLGEIVKLYPGVKFDIPDELDPTRIPSNRMAAQPSPVVPAPVSAPLRTLGEEIQTSTSSARGAFSLQAGAFGSYANAKRLADQIESIGYSSRITERLSNGKTLYVIMVGDYADRTAAVSVADMLEAALEIESFPVAND